MGREERLLRRDVRVRTVGVRRFTYTATRYDPQNDDQRTGNDARDLGRVGVGLVGIITEYASDGDDDVDDAEPDSFRCVPVFHAVTS